MFDETRTTGQLTAQGLSPQEPNSPDTVDDVGSDVLEIVLKDNWISQHQREMLERPENYLRPIRVREYWRPARAVGGGSATLPLFSLVTSSGRG